MKSPKDNIDELSGEFELDLVSFFNVLFEDVMNKIDDKKSVDEIIKDIEDILQ